MDSICRTKNEARNQTKTQIREDNSLCPETSTKNALQEFHLWISVCVLFLVGFNSSGGCMHRRFIIKKTWLSAFSLHSHAFRWLSAAPLVFLFLGFLPLQIKQIWRILCVTVSMEKKVGGGIACFFAKTLPHCHCHVYISFLLCTTLKRQK